MSTIVSLVVGFIELALAFRLIFLLIGADATSSFVSWIYNVTDPLVAPFAGIFGNATPTEGGVVTNVFEAASLVAMLVYGIVGAVLIRVLAGANRGQ